MLLDVLASSLVREWSVDGHRLIDFLRTGFCFDRFHRRFVGLTGTDVTAVICMGLAGQPLWLSSSG